MVSSRVFKRYKSEDRSNLCNELKGTKNSHKQSKMNDEDGEQDKKSGNNSNEKTNNNCCITISKNKKRGREQGKQEVDHKGKSIYQQQGQGDDEQQYMNQEDETTIIQEHDGLPSTVEPFHSRGVLKKRRKFLESPAHHHDDDEDNAGDNKYILAANTDPLPSDSALSEVYDNDDTNDDEDASVHHDEQDNVNSRSSSNADTPEDKIGEDNKDSSSSASKNPHKVEVGRRGKAIRFPVKLMHVLSCGKYDDIISWTADGNSFVLHKPNEFIEKVLPFHFKEVKYPSFTRKLHRWGFVKILRGKEGSAYYQKNFKRGHQSLCEEMRCCKSPRQQSLHPSPAQGESMNNYNPFFITLNNLKDKHQKMKHLSHLKLLQNQSQFNNLNHHSAAVMGNVASTGVLHSFSTTNEEPMMIRTKNALLLQQRMLDGTTTRNNTVGGNIYLPPPEQPTNADMAVSHLHSALLLNRSQLQQQPTSTMTTTPLQNPFLHSSVITHPATTSLVNPSSSQSMGGSSMRQQSFPSAFDNSMIYHHQMPARSLSLRPSPSTVQGMTTQVLSSLKSINNSPGVASTLNENYLSKNTRNFSFLNSTMANNGIAPLTRNQISVAEQIVWNCSSSTDMRRNDNSSQQQGRYHSYDGAA